MTAHKWSYADPPRLALERLCLHCGMECRRQEARQLWRDGCEVRVKGGRWVKVPGLPPCPARDQAVRHRAWATGRSLTLPRKPVFWCRKGTSTREER